jgi:hypothetical protein
MLGHQNPGGHEPIDATLSLAQDQTSGEPQIAPSLQQQNFLNLSMRQNICGPTSSVQDMQPSSTEFQASQQSEPRSLAVQPASAYVEHYPPLRTGSMRQGAQGSLFHFQASQQSGSLPVQQRQPSAYVEQPQRYTGRRPSMEQGNRGWLLQQPVFPNSGLYHSELYQVQPQRPPRGLGSMPGSAFTATQHGNLNMFPQVQTTFPIPPQGPGSQENALIGRLPSIQELVSTGTIPRPNQFRDSQTTGFRPDPSSQDASRYTSWPTSSRPLSTMQNPSSLRIPGNNYPMPGPHDALSNTNLEQTVPSQLGGPHDIQQSHMTASTLLDPNHSSMRSGSIPRRAQGTTAIDHLKKLVLHLESNGHYDPEIAVQKLSRPRCEYCRIYKTERTSLNCNAGFSRGVCSNCKKDKRKCHFNDKYEFTSLNTSDCTACRFKRVGNPG